MKVTMQHTETFTDPMGNVYFTFGDTDRLPLIFLHGIGIGHRLWKYQIREFQATHYVIAPDLVGFTRNKYLGEDLFSQLVQALSEFVTRRNFASVSVCGISAGASLAVGLASSNGGLHVDRLFLSAPQVRAPRVALLLQRTAMKVIPEKTFYEMARQPFTVDEELSHAAQEDTKGIGKTAVMHALRELYGLDLRKNLDSIHAKTVVACGSRDLVNIPSAKSIARQIRGASLHIENGGGHFWNVSHAEHFNRLLRDSLS